MSVNVRYSAKDSYYVGRQCGKSAHTIVVELVVQFRSSGWHFVRLVSFPKMLLLIPILQGGERKSSCGEAQILSVMYHTSLFFITGCLSCSSQDKTSYSTAPQALINLLSVFTSFQRLTFDPVFLLFICSFSS